MLWALASAKKQIADCNVYDVGSTTSKFSKIRVGVGARFMIRVPAVNGREIEIRVAADSALVLNGKKTFRGKARFEILAPAFSREVIRFVTVDDAGTVCEHARVCIEAVWWQSVPYSQMSDADKADFDRRYADLDEEVE